MNYYEEQCKILYKMIKETNNHKFDDLSRKEILTELNSVFNYFLNQIENPTNELLIMDAEQTLIKRTDDFNFGYKVPNEIDTYDYKNEVLIYKLLEEERATGIKAMVPTMIEVPYFIKPALYLKFDILDEILKFIPSNHEAIWDRELKKYYFLGKLILETYKLSE